ncbi:hypothetical protein, partial [Bradyrhizobium sp.]|uniref:hypothetical protein n=1 Tax=Bradyrhizobium sp. TaxID=376 RepID=UPI0028FE3C2B
MSQKPADLQVTGSTKSSAPQGKIKAVCKRITVAWRTRQPDGTRSRRHANTLSPEPTPFSDL